MTELRGSPYKLIAHEEGDGDDECDDECVENYDDVDEWVDDFP
eukprot:CAMPEP_0113522896 /NCGR_PEP_ID=MMETSP0014_2-20120614/45430_1 /TAXON_ID=2857 /ORGANISM="Nitzschia sp." /LENGTH=42 /DNA_ID=CAMNT_0000420977 /DNA_START=114 /DNA_END=243 /DNA_ORIENTATION=- /assembly_acc=CAM_ASM_000159